MGHTRSLGIVAVLGLIASGAPPALAQATYHVIVHPSVRGNTIPRATLSAIFLKQARKWGDGTAVVPVDQSLRSPVREAFCREVLGQQVDAMNVYWLRLVAQGVMPPMVKSSNLDILSFVASTPGSIGYVSSDTPLPDSVRAIGIVN